MRQSTKSLYIKSTLFLISFLFLVMGTSLKAQVLPPEFLCISSDTLFWELPVNNCGSFNAYHIYSSDNLDGPYTLLTSINSVNQTSFFHENANGLVWYYYLESDYNCPGEAVLTSDTLNNLIPAFSPLTYVTVEGEVVEINWEESQSPETFAYIISRNTNAGTTIIDTIFDGTSYIDTTAAPYDQVETYFIVALDQCGNTSLVSAPHNTILLTATETDPCERSISLRWNPYQNWSDGVEAYEIWVSEDGGSPTLFTSVEGNTTSYLFENVNDLVDYCFTIRAIERGTGIISNSTQICQMVDVVQAVRDFRLYNASVTETGRVELSWYWTDNAEINNYSLLRSTDTLAFETVDTQMPSFPLQAINQEIDVTADPRQAQLFYQIGTIDDCNDEALSNRLATIHLQGQILDGGINELSWTDFNQEGRVSVENYNVFRIVDGIASSLASVPLNPRTYTDLVNLGNPGEATACYYVVAESVASLPNEAFQNISTRSNTICLEQKAMVFVPNAFVPDGFNKEFKPVLQFGTPIDYQLVIYDRWGKLVFESESLEIGWTGKTEGVLLPQGVYAYFIKITQEGGHIVEKKGNVLLLR